MKLKIHINRILQCILIILSIVLIYVSIKAFKKYRNSDTFEHIGLYNEPSLIEGDINTETKIITDFQLPKKDTDIPNLIRSSQLKKELPKSLDEGLDKAFNVTSCKKEEEEKENEKEDENIKIDIKPRDTSTKSSEQQTEKVNTLMDHLKELNPFFKEIKPILDEWALDIRSCKKKKCKPKKPTKCPTLDVPTETLKEPEPEKTKKIKVKRTDGDGRIAGWGQQLKFKCGNREINVGNSSSNIKHLLDKWDESCPETLTNDQTTTSNKDDNWSDTFNVTWHENKCVWEAGPMGQPSSVVALSTSHPGFDGFLQHWAKTPDPNNPNHKNPDGTLKTDVELNTFATLEEAKKECDEEENCGGITKNTDGFGLRVGKDNKIFPSPNNEKSWIKKCNP